MAWRVARSLEVLRDQVNAAYPGRSKVNDGTIGDTAHQQTVSDHNPNKYGVVQALDITHDPAHGLDAGRLAEALRVSQDKRIKYVISNRRIVSSSVSNWIWRAYHGANPHTAHVHVSVVDDPKLYDDTSAWLKVPGVIPVPPSPIPVPPSNPVFRSLVPGGFYSRDPFNLKVPTSIRTNNPGAMNVAPWIKLLPGYVGDKVTSITSAPNSTVIFSAPEYGVAAYWTLLKRYRDAGAYTVGTIINRYGGGQDYSDYLNFVRNRTGLSASWEIRGDDYSHLLPFAKAMFRYEAGVETPLSDAQIIYGFNLARGLSTQAPAQPVPTTDPTPTQPAQPGLLKKLTNYLMGR